MDDDERDESNRVNLSIGQSSLYAYNVRLMHYQSVKLEVMMMIMMKTPVVL